MYVRKEFERVSPESVGIDSGDIEWLLDCLESGFTEPHSLMIMRGGKICAEGWWEPYAPGIRHGLQSHSKTYAATAIGIAYTEGVVRLDEKIIDIFPDEAPECPSDNLRKLTVHDVLCMGCGMDQMPKPTKQWIHDFLHMPVTHEPGTTFMYNSMGSSLLAAIIVKKTGLSLHEYLKPRLYDKIGILSDNHLWIKMQDGCEAGGGGLFATTEDNLRLMKLYADGGIWDGERILAEDYVKKAISMQNASATESRNNPLAKDNFLGYGYQIWMCTPKGVYRADGAMGQFTIVVPDKDMIIAITENASGAHWAQNTLDLVWEFLKRIEHEKTDLKIENKEKAEHLKKRMRCLTLPKPDYHPYSPLAEHMPVSEWKVTNGNLYIEDVGMEQHLAGNEMDAPLSTFELQFRENIVELHWDYENRQKTAIIAMDGSRRHNLFSGGLTKQVLMSGAWETENVLEVKARYIETCNENTYRFIFRENRMEINVNSSMNYGQPTNVTIEAERIK